MSPELSLVPTSIPMAYGDMAKWIYHGDLKSKDWRMRLNVDGTRLNLVYYAIKEIDRLTAQSRGRKKYTKERNELLNTLTEIHSLIEMDRDKDKIKPLLEQEKYTSSIQVHFVYHSDHPGILTVMQFL